MSHTSALDAKARSGDPARMEPGRHLAAWCSFVLATAVTLAQATPPEATLAIVRGRCIAPETGAPLAGCKLEFDGRPCNSELMNQYGKQDWKDPEPIVTAADGRFEIRFVPPPPYQHHLDISCAGRVPRTARWGPFKPGQVDDLGDVPLPIGYVVKGRVLDQAGKPVPLLSVGFTNLPLPLREDAANDVRYGFAKDDGSFVVEVLLPAGTWPLRVDSDGCSLVAPAAVEVKAQAEPNHLVVRVQRMPSITGVVFDDRGQPVPRVYVQARPGAGNRMTSAWSRKDGSFTIYKRDGSPDEVRLEIDDPGPCEAVPIDGTFAWETHGLRIELPRALSFELTVVEAGTGKPIEDFAVKCHPAGKAGHSRFTDLRLGTEPHRDGKVIVDKVWRGANVLAVVPRDPALLPSGEIPFDAVPDQLAPRRVEIVRMQAIGLQLVDTDGKAMASRKVWIVDDTSGGRHDLRNGLFTDPRGSRRVMSSDPTAIPLAQSAGATDGEGKVRLFHGPPRGKLALVVEEERRFRVVAEFDPAAVKDGKVVVP